MRLRRSGRKTLVPGNTKGTEQIFICEVHGFHPGGFEKNPGENVQANCPIVEFIGDAALPTKKVQRCFCPVLAGTHLCPRVPVPLIGCTHGKQMPDCHIKDRLFAAFDRILRKVGKHPIIHTADHLMVNSNANQQRHNAFRCGRDMDAVRLLIAVPFCGVEFVSVPKHADLTDVRLMLLYIWISKPSRAAAKQQTTSPKISTAALLRPQHEIFTRLKSDQPIKPSRARIIKVVAVVTAFPK